MTSNAVRAAVLAALAYWPPHNRGHVVTVVPLPSKDRFYVGYHDADRFGLLSLNVQFDDQILYLLEIELPDPLCGKGHGSALYEVVLDVAARLGLKEVRQTPSGWTTTGETREDWLLRRGWVADPLGREVCKSVPS